MENELFYTKKATVNWSNGKITAGSIYTPLVNSTDNRLTLNATVDVALKVSNDDSKSVILNGTTSKPFNNANGLLDLGTSSARWKGLYATTGDFTGTVTANRLVISSTTSNYHL
jgi:hypothetical protein